MKKSVLIVGNFLSHSKGSRGVCEELAERLSARGWQVATASRRHPKLLRLSDMCLTCVRGRHHYAVAQVDVFSGPAFFWAEAVCWILRRLHKPFVLTLHGGNLPAFAACRPQRIRRLLTSASLVTAPSAYLGEKMRPYCPGIRVLPNAIDVLRYPHRVRRPAAPNLVWLRAFHQIYNPVMAVRAVALLARQIHHLHLDMAGPDKGDGTVQQTLAEVRAANVTDKVHFCGQVAKGEVPRLLSRGDIFVNTANIDNTPVSLIEAMACGLPIVSTNVGGIAYLLKNDASALLVAADDHKGMAEAVLRILKDPGLSERLSLNGRREIEQFDWSRVLPEWESILARIAQQAPTGHTP